MTLHPPTLFKAFLITFFIFLSGCFLKKSSKKEINWTSLSMDQAVQKAQKENKPLFVYWGAVWCPPCNMLKTTLFKDPQFIRATEKYISVYLDGDTDQAQKWGEKLKVRGYPTLMVLTPQLKEVVRLSTSGDGSSAAETLNIAYQMTTSTPQVLEELLKQNLKQMNISLLKKKLNLILNYSWEQDLNVFNNKKSFSEKFFQLERLLPDNLSVEKSMIFMKALSLKLDSLSQSNKKENLSESQRKSFKKKLLNILETEELFKKNRESFFYNSSTFTQLLNTTEKERKDFLKHYISKINDYKKKGLFSFEQNLYSYLPLIETQESKKPLYSLTNSEVTSIKKEFYNLLKKVKDPKKRVSLINITGYLFFSIGLKEDAESILTKELKTAINPYYVMSSLGYFEKEKGNKKKALEWYHKAYLSSKGDATKLQWHGKYIKNILSLSPKNLSLIQKELHQLISKNIQMSDAFMSRNLRVLKSVKKSLKKWAETFPARKKILQSFQKEALQTCKKSSFGDFYKNSCLKFFEDLTKP